MVQGYQSFAHCIGGGGASIATSFIFTPSERIKQQMQVGAHYENCWYSCNLDDVCLNTTKALFWFQVYISCIEIGGSVIHFVDLEHRKFKFLV